MNDALVIQAPWPSIVVRRLNEMQESGKIHPYTCGRRGDLPHRFANGDYGVLRATVDGWRCPDCDWRQTWVHRSSLADATESQGGES